MDRAVTSAVERGVTQLTLPFPPRGALAPEAVQRAAQSFLDSLPHRYALWNVITWGLAFTTGEDLLEAAYGEVNLTPIKRAIDAEAKCRWIDPAYAR